ncbi:MAG TPA: ATP-binding cassette domain-containing protein, partial [Streptosporangiaceae bacterium]
MTQDRAGGAAIELRHVTKHYGISKDQQVAAAADISLSIAAGTFVAVSGASGSGKSTLLHMTGAIERPDSGAVISDGTDL